ncbi:MAG: hypothetical protein Rhims3KO_36130 [Hyphomicrobiales bacterium]
MDDLSLEHAVGGKPNGVAEPFGLQLLVDLRRGEGGIAPKVAPELPAPIARDHGIERVAPAIGAVQVARSKRTAFEVAGLVEDK